MARKLGVTVKQLKLPILVIEKDQDIAIGLQFFSAR